MNKPETLSGGSLAKRREIGGGRGLARSKMDRKGNARPAIAGIWLKLSGLGKKKGDLSPLLRDLFPYTGLPLADFLRTCPVGD